MYSAYRGILIVILPLLAAREIAAQQRGGEAVALSKATAAQIIVQRLGENQFEVVLQRSAPAKREKIWGSFWGMIDAKFSPDGHYLAIRDGMRFDVLSPVLIFRIEPAKAALVYETPGAFSAEETHFTYEIGDVQNDRVSIRVFSLERGKSSRATPQFKFEYQVENLDRRQPIDPFFYTGTERGRLMEPAP